MSSSDLPLWLELEKERTDVSYRTHQQLTMDQWLQKLRIEQATAAYSSTPKGNKWASQTIQRIVRN